MDRKQIMLIYIVILACWEAQAQNGPNPLPKQIKQLCKCIADQKDNCFELIGGTDVTVCFNANENDWEAVVSTHGEDTKITCEKKDFLKTRLSMCKRSSGDGDDTSMDGTKFITTTPETPGGTSRNNLTAVYVLVPLIIVVVVIVSVFLLIRRRSRSILHNDDNVPVIEAGPVIPMARLRDSVDVSEYAEIPADAILSSVVPTNSYSTVDVLAVGQHEYGRLKHQSTPINKNYSHMTNISKSTHTDNTYSHIDNGPEPIKGKQKAENDSEDEYNKVQRMPINRTQNRIESKHNKDVECDPDYSHLNQSNWKPNIENQSNSQDEYSHIGQTSELEGQRIHAKTSKAPDYEIADIDETKYELTGTDGEGNTITAAAASKPENGNDDNTAECSDGQYFVLEKHERETDVVSDDETPRDHTYVILEKQ